LALNEKGLFKSGRPKVIWEGCHLVLPPEGKSRDTGKWMKPVIYQPYQNDLP